MRRHVTLLAALAFAAGLLVGWCAGADAEQPREPVPPAAKHRVEELVIDSRLCPGAQTCRGRGEYPLSSGLPLPVRGL